VFSIATEESLGYCDFSFILICIMICCIQSYLLVLAWDLIKECIVLHSGVQGWVGCPACNIFALVISVDTLLVDLFNQSILVDLSMATAENQARYTKSALVVVSEFVGSRYVLLSS